MLSLKNENVVLSGVAPFLILVLGAISIAYLIVFDSLGSEYMILALIAALCVTLLVLNKYGWGLYLLFFMSIFMFYFQRIVLLDFPLGIIYDFFILLTFISLLFNYRDKLDWSAFLNPITWAFVVMILYHLLEVFNPNGTFLAWVVSLRKNTYFLLYIVCFHFLSTYNGIRKFTIVWMGLALIVALYGIYQEMFGLTDFEWNWIYMTPDRYQIYFIWGKMRKFSFLSDPSSYGIFTAFSGIGCLVLSLAHTRKLYKVLFGALALIMFVAMSYSGTRTAYAMVALGLAFYILMTIRSRRTMIFAMILAVGGLAVFFGPFYGWQINRIRSTFYPEEDASMGVRDSKRLRYQPYIQTHPLGGGVYTTAFNGINYAPDHPFAGFDPDSGYLETAMESGWIGLLILLIFIFVVMVRGVDSYFSIRDPLLRLMLLVYLVPFFALSVAHFVQNAIFAKPVDLLVIVTLGLMARAPQLDQNKNNKDA